jgi:glutamine synthetase
MSAQWLDIAWTDLLGRCHLTRVRDDRADDGVPVAIASVAAGYVAPSSSFGSVVLVPDRLTERPNPFSDDAGLAVGSLVENDGTPSAWCARSAFMRVLDSFNQEGYRIQAAAELEFFLLNPETKQPLWGDVNQYSITKGGEIEMVLGRIRRQLLEADIPVEATNPEYSGGQVELNIRHAPAQHAADYAVLARYFAREIVRSSGLDATFLAKPWTDQAGSGLHIHQSLWVGTKNVMHEGGQLSPLARNYLAGQLAHMRELSLLGSSNPNAYHRRAGVTFAPSAISWGIDNRTVAVRAIVGSESATRIEQRDASADCNLYLVFAGQFGSGLDGIRRVLDLAPAVVGNAHDDKVKERLPMTFVEAMTAFSASAIARELLGVTADLFENILRPELEEVLANSSDWERRRYLSAV